jgi:hypothetical protein
MIHLPARKLLALTLSVLAAAQFADATDNFRLESPYAFAAHQHKVQLHAHTTNSDGDHDPQWVMQAYAALGYTAVAITDHHYPGYHPRLDDPGGHAIEHIPGVEYTTGGVGRGFAHMLGINILTIHDADGDANRQAQIDQARAEGGLTYFAHPSDHRSGWYEGQLQAWLKGFSGIEIHNGGTYSNPGKGSDYPAKVDLTLSFGHEFHVIATDDFHRDPERTMDRGYVVINSARDQATITRADLVAALHAGNFFACGRTNTRHPDSPRFTDIAVDGHTITVRTDRVVDIEFSTDRNNFVKGETRYVQKDSGVTEASYTARADDRWIRITATFTGEEGVSYAWSNPIYVRTAAPE